MSDLLLTDQERRRFAEYLEHEAHVTEGIVAQMESIKVPEFLTAKLKGEALASRMVAARLRATESMTVGAEDKA